MKIINTSKKTIICTSATIADTMIARLIGLLNRRSLLQDQGLVITSCRAIHMFFMRFAIDVIFIDNTNSVVGIVKNIQPFQMSPYFLKARSAIEVYPGIIEQSRTEKGDVVDFIM